MIFDRKREQGALTADALKRLRSTTQMLREAGLDVEQPMHSPWQGVNKLAQAAVGGLLQRKLEHEEQIAAERDQKRQAEAVRRLQAAIRPPEPIPAPRATPPQPAGAGGDMSWLLQRESGGRMDAMNTEGYGGRAQFGPERLQDAAAAGIVPPGTTPEMVAMTPDMQPELEQWHFGEIENQIAQRGLDQFVGQYIGGVPVTPEGLKAVAHLGGVEGLEQFLSTGGGYNPTDAYGTSLLDYLALGAEHSDMQPQPQPAGPDMAAIIGALGDPGLPDVQRQIALALLPQLQPQEPAAPVDLGPGHHLVDPATGRPIYQVPEEPDQTTIAQLMAEREALPPGDPRREEYDAAIARHGAGTTVNVDTAQPFGPLKPGERLVRDEEGNPIGIEPIPGGSLERELGQEEEAKATEIEQTLRTANVVTDAASQAANLIDRYGWLTAGPLGGAMSMTGTQEVSNLLDTVRSNVALDTLLRLKKSGGTLGQVSEKELQLLSDNLGKLSVWMKPEVLKENLDRVADIYGRVVEDLSRVPGAAAPAAEEPKVEEPKVEAAAEELAFPAEVFEGIEVGGRPAAEIWEQLTPEAREQLLRDLGLME